MSATPAKVNKIVAYEHPDYKGLCREFTSDIRDLREVGFGDCIASLKVIGQPWVAYEHPDFGGWLREYEEGEYPNIEKHDSISSVRLITDDLKNPQITLYEHPNFQGKSKTFTMETNLTCDYFNDMASSHIVERGAWILYQHSNRRGWRVLARAGEKLPDYGIIGFQDRASHIYPLKAGRPVVKSKVLWDQVKKENEICSLIDEIIAVNRSDLEQEFIGTHSREYDSSVTYDFKFCNTTTIEAGIKIEVQPLESSRQISNSFTVEKGKSESVTTEDKIQHTMLTKVPPHTKMTIKVVQKECTVTVPVELTVEQNEKETTEYGVLRCEMGNSISVEYESEKI
ncbi:epidermal differentiation-specific protein-like [Rhinatrema bivittatum]|uniref:epidermal differentiation-specific protein-like n=1 Tax=Rhinatrema bivittatum TaxID=194408 RepID=UPI00112858B7|nr:epidermal differentiation-specific protein-like [Rhinatrema bivittatum]